MSQSKITILIADDHAILRTGLRLLFSLQSDMEVVAEARNGREAVAAAQRHAPGVVLIDIAMPEQNGIDSTRQICQELPATKVIGLSMHRDSVYVREMLRAGARGYLLKDSGDEDLLTAIRAVARGEAYLSPAISDVVLADYRRHVVNPIDLLTSREREVLTLVAEGHTNKGIALSLNLSIYTVESHRGHVMEKLNLHSTGEMVRFALRNGLIR